MLYNVFMQRECKIWNLRGDEKNREYREDSRNFLCSLKKKYLWVMLLNLEMNNKETELISTKKGAR